MKKWLFNPFVYIAGTRALGIGLGAIIVTAIIAFFSHTHFDGAIDVHFGPSSPFINYFLEPLIDWACLIASMYVLGRMASDSSVRFIDIVGTFALARWPFFFVSFLGFIPTPVIDPKASIDVLINQVLSPSVIIQGLISLPFIIWSIALLYNAFSISANVKGGKAVWSFIGGLIIAEVISKIVLAYLFKH